MELPRTFLYDLAASISFPGFFQGSGASFTRGRKRRLGLRVIKIALVAPEVDGNLQFMPLFHQPKTIRLEARVYIRELPAKLAHRAHRLLEELVADGAPFVCSFEHVADSVLHSMGRRQDPKRLAPFQQGAGG